MCKKEVHALFVLHIVVFVCTSPIEEVKHLDIKLTRQTGPPRLSCRVIYALSEQTLVPFITVGEKELDIASVKFQSPLVHVRAQASGYDMIVNCSG